MSIILIERDVANSINYDVIVQVFASEKVRKLKL